MAKTEATEINATNEEFQAAVAELETLTTAYEEARAPYIAATAALVAGIDRVGTIDDKLEQLTKDYEPPAKP